MGEEKREEGSKFHKKNLGLDNLNLQLKGTCVFVKPTIWFDETFNHLSILEQTLKQYLYRRDPRRAGRMFLRGKRFW